MFSHSESILIAIHFSIDVTVYPSLEGGRAREGEREIDTQRVREGVGGKR